MVNVKLAAEVYRIGFSIGVFTIQEVIKWADRVIENLDSPPYEIIDLSLSSKLHTEKFMWKLESVQGKVEQDLAPKVLLGLLRDTLDRRQDLKDVINKMDKLIQYIPENCGRIEMEIHYLSDAFYLAENGGYRDLQEVRSELEDFLDEFVEFSEDFVKAKNYDIS